METNSYNICNITGGLICNSINKAIFMDASASLFLGDTGGLRNIGYDALKYFIRASSKILITHLLYNKEILPEFSKIASAIVAGSLGGSFKYCAVGQNIAAGIINNAGYELCDINNFCKTLVGSFVATVALEIIDPVLRIVLTGVDVENKLMALNCKTVTDAVVFATVAELIYTPNENYFSNMVNCTSTYCWLSTTVKIVPDTISHANDIIQLAVSYAGAQIDSLFFNMFVDEL